MASDFRAAFLRLTAAFQDRLAVSAEVSHELLATMQRECEQHQSRWTLVFAFGQKEVFACLGITLQIEADTETHDEIKCDDQQIDCAQ